MYKLITYKQAVNFLLPRHYSGRIPSISYAFGEFIDNKLEAVCTFGSPASSPLCKGIAGDKWKHNVIELNRLCREDDYKNQLSKFVSWCLRQLKQYNLIVVSYSDTAMNHHGYIYQACNFLYTGMTKRRTDKYTEDGKHPRHYKNNNQGKYRVVRSAKYRYIYIYADKRTKREILKDLKYPIIREYPKGDNNEDYVLGNYLQRELVKVDDNI